MNAMPTTHWLPMALTEGMKGCGGCHRIGLKTEDDLRQARTEGATFGLEDPACAADQTTFLSDAGCAAPRKQPDAEPGGR